MKKNNNTIKLLAIIVLAIIITPISYKAYKSFQPLLGGLATTIIIASFWIWAAVFAWFIKWIIISVEKLKEWH